MKQYYSPDSKPKYAPETIGVVTFYQENSEGEREATGLMELARGDTIYCALSEHPGHTRKGYLPDRKWALLTADDDRVLYSFIGSIGVLHLDPNAGLAPLEITRAKRPQGFDLLVQTRSEEKGDKPIDQQAHYEFVRKARRFGRLFLPSLPMRRDFRP